MKKMIKIRWLFDKARIKVIKKVTIIRVRSLLLYWCDDARCRPVAETFME